jgi:hypothetical protein
MGNHGEEAAVHRRYIALETVISMIINIAFSALFFFLVFARSDHIDLWGKHGFALDYFPQTFMIALMSIIVPTIFTRKRVNGGRLARRGSAFGARLPRSVILRAILLACAACVTLGAVAVWITASFWSGEPAHSNLLLLKLAYGAVVAAVLTPVGLVAALSDDRPRAALGNP